MFCVLSSCTRGTAPDNAHIRALGEARLGIRQLQLPLTGSAGDLHNELIGTFPQLLTCGGYEIMRAAPGSRTLLPVGQSSRPVTAQYLSADVRPSTKLYVRPIQRDIPTQRNTVASTASLTETEQVMIIVLVLQY